MHMGLVKKSKQGDGIAFSELIRLHQKDLYRVALAMMKNDNDALDCIQETILNAYKNLKGLTQDEYFKTWLLRILINKCNDSLKKKEKLVSWTVPQPEEQHHDDATRLDVINAISHLEKDLKVIVVLYYYEDMSVTDIADSLRIPQGTVKSRLSRAREQLRELLGYEERGVPTI